MTREEKFSQQIQNGYQFEGLSITIGSAILDGKCMPKHFINIPLKTLNRHGLIAGATGTGKTKTLQSIAEKLSESGVPVLMMDIKGDLSGLAAMGESNDKITKRHENIGIPYLPKKFPVELLSISSIEGTRMRATISEFGPVLFSKILELNDTQSGIVTLIFKWCDDKKLPLLDLKDFKKVLQYITNEGKEEVQKEYGNISSSSVSTILRKIIELEQQGAEKFFGELSFDVADLTRLENNKGVISLIKLTDIQDRPKLFSTFILCLLAEVYANFPEEGDLEKPKLVIFIDEAHLIFNEASKALLDQIETIIKLIRSKGVGIFFCTQNPADIPASILGQLGLKVQHALRAFTANDRKAIKMTAENYPISDFYKTEELLTSLGIGEAAITVLNEKGSPSPLVATMLCAPSSRMNVLSNSEISSVIAQSAIATKYNQEIDRESAYEKLSKKFEKPSSNHTEEANEEEAYTPKVNKEKNEKGTFEQILSSPLAKQVGRTVVQELTRGLLGVLGIKKTSSRRRY
jgi:hypothetical protein